MKSIVDYTNKLKDYFATKQALTPISVTGTTNNTGATIKSGTFFYLNGTLVKAKADIANGATLTLNTNYKVVVDGGLNEIDNLDSDWTVKMFYTVQTTVPEYTRTSQSVIKIGHLVFLTFRINLTSVGSGSQLKFTGINNILPYTPRSHAVGTLMCSAGILAAGVSNNGTEIYIVNQEGGDATSGQISNGNVTVSIVYATDD